MAPRGHATAPLKTVRLTASHNQADDLPPLQSSPRATMTDEAHAGRSINVSGQITEALPGRTKAPAGRRGPSNASAARPDAITR